MSVGHKTYLARYGSKKYLAIHVLTSAAGVVVSCKIPILVTRVRFPGGAFALYSFEALR